MNPAIARSGCKFSQDYIGFLVNCNVSGDDFFAVQIKRFGDDGSLVVVKKW